MGYRWIKIAASIEELPQAPLSEIQAGNKTICLARHNEQLFACAEKCPHAGGKMANGYIDAVGNIVCPLHRYKFSLENGRNVSGEGYFLRHFPIEVRSDGVFVGLKENIWGF